MRSILCIIIFLSWYETNCQQLPLFTQYREHNTLINPGAITSDYMLYEYNFTVGISSRFQWINHTNNPKTQTVQLDYLYQGRNTSMLFGGSVTNDQTGPSAFTGANGKIGVIISSDPYYGGISIGMTLGALQHRINVSEITLLDPNDIVGINDQSQIIPDIGFGIYAYKRLEKGIFDGDNIYIGLSAPQTFGFNLNFNDDQNDFIIQRVRHFYGMIGMNKFYSSYSYLEPSLWVKYIEGSGLHVDANLKFQISNLLWLGFGASSSKFVHLEFGILLGENIGMDNQIKLGYGYDNAFSTFGPFFGTSHEVNISYSFDW